MSLALSFVLAEALRDAPPPDSKWLVEPFAPAGGILLLHGPPGIGKSQLALTLSLAVARGEPFLVPEYRAVAGKVVYFQLDMSRGLVQDRLGALGALLPKEALAFVVSEESAVNSLDPNFLPSRLPALREAQAFGPSLVVVDSLRDVHFSDEWDPNTAASVYGVWRRLFPGTTIAFIHHDRKTPAGLVLAEPSLDSARGSGAWVAKANAALQLARAGRGLRLAFSKVRSCPFQPVRMVRLHPETLLVEVYGDTGPDKLARFLGEHPGATLEEARTFLLDAKVDKGNASRWLREAFPKATP